MKRFLLYLIIVAGFSAAAHSQVLDTVHFQFKASGSDGKFRQLENKVTYLGQSAGMVLMNLQIPVTAIDTLAWGLEPVGGDGKFRALHNIVAFYGKDSGSVIAQIVSQADTVFISHENPFNAYGYPSKDSANTFTKQNTFDSSVTLPPYTDLGVHDLATGSGWDTTCNEYAGTITYTNNDGITNVLLGANTSQEVKITCDKLTANSLVIICIATGQGTSYALGGIALISEVAYDSHGWFLFLLSNPTANDFTNGISIKWKIIN